MSARQYPHFAADGADFRGAAPIGPDAQIQNPPPHFPLDHILETLGDAIAGKLLAQLRRHFLLNAIQALVPFRLKGVLFQNFRYPPVGEGFDLGIQPFRFRGVVLDLVLGLPDLADQFVNQVNGQAVGFEGFADALEDDFLGNFVGAGFHHHNGVPGAGDDHIQAAGGDFIVGGIDDKPAVIVGNPAGPNRPGKGQVGQGQGRRGPNHPQDFRRILLVGGEDCQDNLDFVVQALGKEGADGAVGEPGGEDGFLAGAAFPTEKAARNFAGGIKALLVFHRQGQKVDVGPGLFGHHRRSQQDGLAIGQNHGAMGLERQFAGLHNQRFRPDNPLNNSSVRHNKVA